MIDAALTGLPVAGCQIPGGPPALGLYLPVEPGVVPAFAAAAGTIAVATDGGAAWVCVGATNWVPFAGWRVAGRSSPVGLSSVSFTGLSLAREYQLDYAVMTAAAANVRLEPGGVPGTVTGRSVFGSPVNSAAVTYIDLAEAGATVAVGCVRVGRRVGAYNFITALSSRSGSTLLMSEGHVTVAWTVLKITSTQPFSAGTEFILRELW